ncbi:hypothetical protein AB1395_05595 [Streptococcus pluranimalium]|uniref:hypothetical protein n=1 Tax=Streptococcus pluranimalium TaxID=82348 RepID=UPI003465AC95
MRQLARINFHLPDDVLTINAFYVLHMGMERLDSLELSFLQVQFRSEFWEERAAFPDKGYLLEEAVLGKCIQSISLLNQTGELNFYHLPYLADQTGANRLQRSGLRDDGSLVIEIGELR